MTVSLKASADGTQATIQVGGVDKVIIGAEGIESGALRTKTAQSTTSGTFVDFTAIPSWVKRITISLSTVSFSTDVGLALQLVTSGGVQTTGYIASASFVSAAVGTPLYSTARFPLTGAGAIASETFSGVCTLVLVDSTTNTWALAGNLSRDGTAGVCLSAGRKVLASALTGVRLTSTTDTAVFDTGVVNILYE